MDDDDLRRLREVGTEARIAAGQMLIERGQQGSGLFVLLDGTVVVDASEGTRELGAGAVLGERSLFSAQGARTARVRAVTDVRVLAVDRDQVERLCAEDAGFARRLGEAD